MSNAEKKLEGPDLTAGIVATSLADGDMLLGHAQGEAVLLARVGREYFAIGASCTHYGGPLAEGLLVGDSVRCPWHHACFSVRTGEAVRAPALNPVARWGVEQRGGSIVVTGKTERGPLDAGPELTPSLVPPRRIVIVGAGAAGAAAAEMLRRLDYAGTITIVDAEPASPYDRPNLSKDYLAGNAPEEWIPLRPDGFYVEHGIEIVRAQATRLDLRQRRLELAGHDAVPFDTLLLATGAEPVRLQIPGGDLPHVHYLRSLSDSRTIVAAAKDATRAVVIGGSFIGLEVAASLRTRGLDVHVVAPERVPLERVLGTELGIVVRSLHEAKGVAFHLGRTVDRIERVAVVLENGERLAADLVVVGIGVRPRLALAEAAGLHLDRGVAVNQYLESSVPGVYAAGDIARWPDVHTGDAIRVEHWVVAERQGQTVAHNMLGFARVFDAVPFFWSAHYDVSINYVGHAEQWDKLVIDGDPASHDVAVRFIKAGRTRALATIFRDKESLEFETAVEQKRPESIQAGAV